MKRAITSPIQSKMDDSKVIILMGPRLVGKTILLKSEFLTEDTLLINGDGADIRLNFSEYHKCISETIDRQHML